MSKKSFLFGLAFFLASLFIFMGFFYLLLPQAEPRLKESDFTVRENEGLTYVAIGDSLTEGVGDSTGQGGFVPLLSQSIETNYAYKVSAHNFGVAGNTSKQILTRMTEDSDIADRLAEADVMTLTVGGNDVMSVIRKNLSDLELSTFDRPFQSYQVNLRKIIALARRDNPDLTIYVIGIYNPFYLNFPELTDMQVVVDNWNQGTQESLEQFEEVYFVPINDLIYKGIDGKEGVVQESGDQTRVINDALFEGDHFHPNNTGYQIMQTAVLEKMNETKDVWQKN